MTAPLYNAQISAGSLMLPESRRIARLMLTHPDSAAWLDALKTENILQKKSPATARRQARLIRNRLETLDEEAWRLVADGDQELSLQILLAASVKHSRLLGDFMREVVAGHLRRYEHTLSPADWEAFLADCTQRDPAVATWSASTKAKLLQVTLRILAEARYVESTRSLRLKLAESLQVAFDAGAKRILLPMSSVTDIATVPGELFAKFQTSFYSDPVDAVFKALGVE